MSNEIKGLLKHSIFFLAKVDKWILNNIKTEFESVEEAQKVSLSLHRIFATTAAKIAADEFSSHDQLDEHLKSQAARLGFNIKKEMTLEA